MYKYIFYIYSIYFTPRTRRFIPCIQYVFILKKKKQNVKLIGSPRTPRTHRRRSPPAWRRHCRCDTCSTRCTVRPAAAAATRPAAECRNRRKCQSPGPDARRPKRASGPICSCTVRDRSGAAENRPESDADGNYQFRLQNSQVNRVRSVPTYIQAGQTVPAEDVLAAFAHHLRATLVLLDGHRAGGATFDQIVVKRNANVLGVTFGDELTRVLLAGHGRMPLKRRERIFNFQYSCRLLTPHIVHQNRLNLNLSIPPNTC